ncbi:MAG TPA: MarR family transcriptional regulator [Streptosporangiaceae bacterium]|jgi:MarR family transcriptional regulator, organic hydroperoxide resistance regulator|nr:MarR family transcriptional regulator [Streptosporangiaceae bacterium]
MDELLGTVTALDAEPVPHATPLVTGKADDLDDADLNQQITDTMGELFRHAHDMGQVIAAEFGLTMSDTKALIMLETPMTMKDLGLRMGCDPSFVTSVADALEKHGLARREPSLRDRRSKNIVLTPEGVTLRNRLWTELSSRAPWCTTLDVSERRCLLGLMRKMLKSRCGR